MNKILLFAVIVINYSYAQNSNINVIGNYKLQGKYEIGFTPRFSYLQTFVYNDNDTAFNHFEGIFRLQAGREILANNYLDIVVDYHVRKSNIVYLPNYDGLMIGLQYRMKFLEATYQKRFKIFNRNMNLIFYPELMLTFGLTNFQQEDNDNQINVNGFRNIHYAIGTGLPFYLNKRFNLQLNWQIQYYPSWKDKILYKFIQTQIVYKL